MRILRIATAVALGLLFCQLGGAAPKDVRVALNEAEAKNARSCQENLAKLDGAKEQYALEYKLANATTITLQNILDPGNTGEAARGYLRRRPVCPSGGTYTLNVIGEDPTCSLGTTKGHSFAAQITIVDEATSASKGH